MNTSSLQMILLFFVGMLATSDLPIAMAVSKAPACMQIDRGRDEDNPFDRKQSSQENDGVVQKPGPVDPMSPKIFAPEPTSVFLAPSREFIRPLVRAMRLHQEGDHNYAAELIGEFLVEFGDEDFLVFTDKEKGTAYSVSSIATAMLSKLPKSALEEYRVRYGVPARQRLNLAIAESNYFEISQVMQRYLYTDAGTEAALLMGHYHFDAGRPLLAAGCFQAVLDLGELNRNSDPELSILTAVSWSLARRPKLAEAVMKDLASSNGGKFRLGGKEVTIDPEDPLAVIKAFISSEPLVSASTVDQWLLVGGNSRRNVTSTGGFPVGQPLWSVDVAGGKTAQQKTERDRKFITSEPNLGRNSLVPANVPLVVDGVVLVGNQKQIRAVDFNTGKRVWALAPIPESNSNVESPPQVNMLIQRVQVSSRSTPVNPTNRTPWTDFLQGHASSDGNFIFHVVKSSVAPDPVAVRPSFSVPGLSDSLTPNVLQALDVRNEGALAWEAGGGKTTGDPRLAEVSFLGAPLPVDGVLYAIGKRQQEIVLVALNSEDGKLVWLQSLASSEDSSRGARYSRKSIRLSHSLKPSFSNGILVCPTGKSAMVAVDTIGRRLLWGMQMNVGKSSRSSSSPILAFQNPQVLIENSKIVAFDVSKTPRLLVLDLFDGSPLLKIGKSGEQVRNVLHIASVDENQVVMVEKTGVRAVAIDGSDDKLWKTSIADFGPPTGRGYVSQSALYLPTEDNAIVKIDLKNGKIVDGVQADQPFGNLVVHQGRVISRRETSVSCFELDSKVAEELSVAAKAAGGIEGISPMLKIKRAAMFRNKGQVKEAIELLETIPEDEQTDRFKVEFLQNAISLFESDPEFALKLCKKHENWFRFKTNPKMFLSYVELLVENNLAEDVLEQLFQDDSFFMQSESGVESTLFERPIAGYNLEAPIYEGNAPAYFGNRKRSDKAKDADDAFDDNEAADEKGDEKGDEKKSAFLINRKGFSKSRIWFGPVHWAKTQLIRMARDFPESEPQIRAAIEQRIASAEFRNPLQGYQFLRQFPLDLVSPQRRFKLAQQLIAKTHVAEAESMFASLLGFLPTSVEQINATEIPDGDFTKESLAELWSQIRSSGYGLKPELPQVAGDQKVLDYNRARMDVIRVPRDYQRDYPTDVELRGELVNQLFKGKRLAIWGYAQELEIYGPTGESESRFCLFEDGVDGTRSLRNGGGLIQANHTVALLRQNNLLVAMDLSKLDIGQAAVLWHRTVLPKLDRRPGIAGEIDPLELRRLQPEDVTVSFPETGCCCFIDRSKLTCVDVFTGETLWARTRDVNHVRVLASGSQVVTMDAMQGECSVFDLTTGERVRTIDNSKQAESLWDVDGLSFMATSIVQEDKLEEVADFEDYRLEDEDENKNKNRPSRLLSRFDTGAGEFVWRKLFNVEARISRMSGDRFLVLSEDNLIYVFDSKSGEELAKMPSGLTEGQRKKIKYMGAVEHAGQDLIVLATVKTGSISTGAYRIRVSRSLSTFFSGHLLLMSQGKPELVWARPAELTGFQFLPMLPSTSPLLVFNRSIQSSRGSNVGGPGQMPVITGSSLQLLGLDIKTGQVALNQIVGSASSTVRFNSPKVDPVAGTIDMTLGDWEVKLSVETSLDEPPAPVASVTKSNPVQRTYETSKTANATGGGFAMEESNKKLILQAQQYEASLEEKRKKERALLDSEINRSQ